MNDFEMTAFEPFTITNSPSTTLYRDGIYRSDREYLDASGDRWVYVGMCDGDPLWHRESEQTAWNINTVVDQFGPLTEVPRRRQLNDVLDVEAGLSEILTRHEGEL